MALRSGSARAVPYDLGFGPRCESNEDKEIFLATAISLLRITGTDN